ncbi:MAG: BON domain-containing protein [Actinomycetota bacterium]|nr:BON domain-containing protein [Actinomycetota bacterium]
MAKTTKTAGTLFGTRTGRKATVTAARAASKAATKSGKAQAKLAKRALSSSEPSGWRFLKYGIFALGGFAIGALVARSSGGSEDVSSNDGAGSSAGQQGTVPESGVAEAPLQKPEDPNSVGAERSYSDPSGGPLIGRSHNPEAGDVPVQHEELENRIRTRIGENPRTLGMQHLNVEVNDDVVDIRGVAPSQNAKEAVSEIAADTPGVREVRNLMTVTS